MDPTATPSLGPEFHEVDIPVAGSLLDRVAATAARADVARGGFYDAQIRTVAVYDRPWPTPNHPGTAQLLGMIHLSTRTERVYRIEVYPDTGASFDDLLTHLERLMGLDESRQ